MNKPPPNQLDFLNWLHAQPQDAHFDLADPKRCILTAFCNAYYHPTPVLRTNTCTGEITFCNPNTPDAVAPWFDKAFQKIANASAPTGIYINVAQALEALAK